MIHIPSFRQAQAQRGQAMAEFVIWVFVLLLMIEGIRMFGKAYELKLTCHMAARYMATAAASVAETDLEDSTIQSRAQVYYPMFLIVVRLGTWNASSKLRGTWGVYGVYI